MKRSDHTWSKTEDDEARQEAESDKGLKNHRQEMVARDVKTELELVAW